MLPDDPAAPDVRELLTRHLEMAVGTSPPGFAFALDVSGLQSPDVSFFSARKDGVLLGVGALRRIDATHAEVKSMHTAEEARGQGVARTVLTHLVATARERDYDRLSLETGSMAEFEPACALYRSFGFEVCGPFADYPDSDYSVFMTLALS